MPDAVTRRLPLHPLMACLVAAAALASCGGSNPFDNPSEIENPPTSGGQHLSYAYFQRCIQPIFLAELPVHQGGTTSINTCASSGCHDDRTGTGGAFRVRPDAVPADLAAAADVIRTSDMYKNYYSAQAATVIGSPTESRLLIKPLVQGVLHGGGVVFETPSDPNAKLIAYWISHPMPTGQDEFGSASAALFTPNNVATGACNVE